MISVPCKISSSPRTIVLKVMGLRAAPQHMALSSPGVFLGLGVTCPKSIARQGWRLLQLGDEGATALEQCADGNLDGCGQAWPVCDQFAQIGISGRASSARCSAQFGVLL